MLKDIILFTLSLIILAAFFFAAYFILSDKIETTDTQALLLIGTAFGAVASQASSVCAYWFGTSKSSSDKDKQITDMKNKGTP